MAAQDEGSGYSGGSGGRGRGRIRNLASAALNADMTIDQATAMLEGMAVTMDFRQDRVTVQVDAQNRIERASCG